MDDQTRDLLEAIRDALAADPHGKTPYRVESALYGLLEEGSTATPEWAAEFIRRGAPEGGDAIEQPGA
jgi:hypothetical protein